MASAAVTKWKRKAEAATKRSSNLTKKVREAKVPNALAGGATVLAGAAVAGYVGESLPDFGTGLGGEVIAALVGTGVGIGMGGDLGASLILASAGMVAPYVHKQVRSGELTARVNQSISQAQSAVAGG